VVAVRTGAAIAFGAHYSKGNQARKESIDRVGGSGVFARDPDSLLNFTRHEERDCFTVEMTLRNHPPQKPFVVKWEYPCFAWIQHSTPQN
jgi:RecA-family ATPase